MSLERSSTNFRVYEFEAKLTDESLAGFAENALPPIETLKEDPLEGWVSPRHLLDSEIVGEIGRTMLDSAESDFKDFEKAGFEHPVNYEYSLSILPVHFTDKYVTYSSTSYTYLGGAHGGTISINSVFRFSDGKLFGWDMFRDDAGEELASIVKEGIMEKYFGVETEDEFAGCLLVNPAEFPLPDADPFFMADGVHFIYQQYEIAPYAAGMPECTIPYDVLSDLLTPEAKDLL